MGDINAMRYPMDCIIALVFVTLNGFLNLNSGVIKATPVQMPEPIG